MLEHLNVSIETIPDQCRVECRLEYGKLVNPCLKDGIERWVHLGIKPGDFLTAVITNDLKNAVTYADDMNRLLLSEIVKWCYNNIPAPCWGSMEIAKKWQQYRQEALEKALEFNYEKGDVTNE